MSLLQLLYELEERLRGMGAPVVDYLAPGLPREEATNRLTAHFGWEPADLVDWFTWHNGIVPNPTKPPAWYASLIAAWQPRSLEQACSAYARLDPILREDNIPRLPERWLPLLTNPNVKADIRVQPADDEQRLEVWRTDLNEVGPDQRVAGSLTELVLVWIDAFEHGGLHLDPESHTWTTRADESMSERFIQHPGVV